jgi:cyclophilin family peptidyl-prolyl cis-trans isomerase
MRINAPKIADMRNQRILGALWAFTLLMLGACGGGGGSSTGSIDNGSGNPGVTPTVSVEITSEPSPPMYFALNTFIVTGDGVDGLSVSAQGACTGVNEAARTASNQRRFTCRPGGIGVDAITITARNPQTQAQKIQAFTIPKPQVTLSTSLGPLVVTLEPERAPLSTNNFLEIVATGFYDGTSLHETAEGNRALGGLYKLVGTTWSRQPSPALPPVKFESPLTTGLSNTAGTLAVYREGAALLDSGTTGFLVNLGNHGTDANGNIAVNNNRDGKSTRDISAYAVFGSVNTEGYGFINNAARTSQQGQLAGPDSPTYMIPAPPISISTARQTR